MSRSGHPVGHDANRRNSEIVEADDIVEPFHDLATELSDELAAAGFLQAARLLAEQFDASMKTLWEPVLGGWFFVRAFDSGELLVFLLLLCELDIAVGPCQDFAVFGEHRVEDTAAE